MEVTPNRSASGVKALLKESYRRSKLRRRQYGEVYYVTEKALDSGATEECISACQIHYLCMRANTKLHARTTRSQAVLASTKVSKLGSGE